MVYKTTSFFLATLFLCFFSATSVSAAPIQQCDAPNVLILLDHSIRYDLSQSGFHAGIINKLSGVLKQYEGKIKFGVIRYSSEKSELIVPVGPEKLEDAKAHTSKLLAALTKGQYAGQPTMKVALSEAIQYLQMTLIPNDKHHKDPNSNVQRIHAIWLVTTGSSSDGIPFSEIQKLRSLQVGSKTYSIPTYVVGVGQYKVADGQFMTQLATYGGTVNFFSGNNVVTFESSLVTLGQELATPRERCNTIDDDCDGLADEGLLRSCNTNCGPGVQTCKEGKWEDCQKPAPTEEVCDGHDNDCNGKIDELPTISCRSACGVGEQKCLHGDWTPCSAPVPKNEICDGKDNDCDGKIDDVGEACPIGRCLKEGTTYRCDSPCRNGECPSGSTCDSKTDQCRVLPCSMMDCPAGLTCVNEDDKAECVDLCEGKVCGDGLTCGLGGTCVRCSEKPCPPKMVCKNGQCEEDRCLGMQCSDGQACSDGACYFTCATLTCKAGYSCQTLDPNLPKGVCIVDPCSNLTCAKGRACVKGLCVLARCEGEGALACSTSQICDPARAICTDNPCAWTHCPKDTRCDKGECVVGKTQPNECPQAETGGCCKDSHCGVDGRCVANQCVRGELVPSVDGGVLPELPPGAAGGSERSSVSSAGCGFSIDSDPVGGLRSPFFWAFLMVMLFAIRQIILGKL